MARIFQREGTYCAHVNTLIHWIAFAPLGKLCAGEHASQE
jgi:hypothetical protein